MSPKRYYIIDLIKYVCACAVVFLHVVNVEELTGTQEIVKDILYYITMFIVPVEFFFTIASFFFWKANPDNNKFFKYIKRLSILYFIYSFFYIDVIVQNFHGRTLLHNILSLINQIFIVGYSSFSWYIPSLIYGLTLIYLLKKYIKNDKVMCAIIIFITIIELSATSYLYIMPNCIQNILKIFPTSIFRSPIYILLGYYIANNFKNENVGSVKSNIIGWISAFIFMIIEKNVLNYFELSLNQNITIFKILTIFFMIRTVLNFEIIIEKFYNQNICNALGKASTVIYFLHMFCKSKLELLICNVYIEWIIIIVILTAITIILDIFSRNNKLKWIKVLY